MPILLFHSFRWHFLALKQHNNKFMIMLDEKKKAHRSHYDADKGNIILAYSFIFSANEWKPFNHIKLRCSNIFYVGFSLNDVQPFECYKTFKKLRIECGTNRTKNMNNVSLVDDITTVKIVYEMTSFSCIHTKYTRLIRRWEAFRRSKTRTKNNRIGR